MDLPTPPRAYLPARRRACFCSPHCPLEELHSERARWQHEMGRSDDGRVSGMGSERMVRGRWRMGTGCLAE